MYLKLRELVVILYMHWELTGCHVIVLHLQDYFSFLLRFMERILLVQEKH